MRGKRTESPWPGYRRAAGYLAPLAVLAVAALAASDATAVSLKPSTPTSDSDIVFVGGPGDLMPSALATGRFNSDGIDDVLSCSWYNNSCWLFYGAPTSRWRVTEGDVVFVGPSGGFGGSATFLGDINGDGYQDIGIGAPTTAGAGAAVQGGSLWIFFGRASTYTGSIGYYDADLVVFSTQSYARLGDSASAAGDMNGDGVDDFWVGASLFNGSTGKDGSLFLFLGKRNFPATINETTAALAIEGVTPPANRPLTLLGNRDLNRDGRPDVVVASGAYVDLSGAVAGAAHVFLGPLPRAAALLTTANADVQIWGTSTVPSMGRSLAFAPNFSRGGAPTLVVGADDRAGADGGAVYLFNSSQFACCQVLMPWNADGLIYSGVAGDGAGTSLAVGDLDGDGLVDLAVGAPYARNSEGSAAGRVYLFYGNVTARAPVPVTNATGWIEGPGAGSHFGELLVSLNLNDDGKADIVVGAPAVREGPASSGADYAFYGRLRNRPPTVSITVPTNATEGEVFYATINVSDMDDDRLSWTWALGGAGGPGDHRDETTVSLRFAHDGTYWISVQVFDGEYYAYFETSVLVANAPPVCEITPIGDFVEGQPGSLSLNVSDPGGDALTFEWSGPAGLTPDDRFAYFTPPRGRPFEVNVTAVDDAGAVGTCTRRVAVANVAPTVHINAPGTVYEGDYLTFGASAEDPGEPEDYTFVWAGPAGPVQGATIEWWATTPGFYAFDVMVTDQDEGVGSARAVVHVQGRPPQVSLIVPTGIYEGDAVNMSVEQVSGWEYDNLSITWQVCEYGTLLDGRDVFRILRAIPGRFCVYARVVDDDGDVVQLEGSLNVANRPPLSGLRVSPEPPFAENQELEFRPRLSPYETADTSQIRFNWTVDDIRTEGAYTFQTTLPAGEHRITVEATDPDGGVSRFSVLVVIENIPPTVTILGPTEVPPGALSTWVASASDPAGGPVTVEWEVDGVPSTRGAELEWSSRTAGPHVIRVYATDASGATASAALTVEVLGPPTVGAGIDLSWVGMVVGAGAAFAAGIVLGAYVLDRLRNRRKVDEAWKR